MKQFLFTVFIISLTFMACSTTKITHSDTLTQGISGYVVEARGNQMPMKGAPVNNPKGILATVLVYEPTNLLQVSRVNNSPLYTAIRTNLVATVVTDSTGFFFVVLPVGKYSLFIKKGEAFYANVFDQFNNISLYEVETGKYTTVKLTMSSDATY